MAPCPTLIRRRLAPLTLLLTLMLTVLPPAEGSARRDVVWSDVDADDKWARSAIDHVGATNDWMRDFAPNPDGTYPFQPATMETRKYFARAVVLAFAPTDVVDPTITFADFDPSDALHPYANVAVQRGWMRRTPSGGFAPDKPVTTTMVHRALTLALGMGPAIKSLNHLHTADGARFQLPPNFGSCFSGCGSGFATTIARMKSNWTSAPRRRSRARRSPTRSSRRRRSPRGTFHR